MRLPPKPLSLVRSIGRDTRGTILVQFTVMSLAAFGLAGLALDGARYLLLNSALQNLADAAALAGAADLDGSDMANDAVNDATNFASSNNVRWYDILGVKINSVHLYASYAAISHGTNTDSDPRKGQYIRVTTGAWGVTPTLLAAVGAPANNTSTSAVAQSYATACAPLQMMLCNPNENPDGGGGGAFSATRGQSFIFSETNPASQSTIYAPGNFNLIVPPSGGSGDQSLTIYLSQQHQGVCVGNSQSSGVSPDPGNKTNATKNGINVRFDQGINGNGLTSSGVDQTPAPIIVDGYYDTDVDNETYSFCANGNSTTTNNNNPSEANYQATCGGTQGTTISCGLPLDATYTPTTSTSIGGGVSSADLLAYWQNHQGSGNMSLPFSGPSGSSADRYDAYSYEVNNLIDSTWVTDGIQPHTPPSSGPNACIPATSWSGTTLNPNRRMLEVAVVDCVYWQVHGASTTNIPINTYADFFVTNPTDQSGNIYTEFEAVHSIAAQNAPLLHQVINLVKDPLAYYP